MATLFTRRLGSVRSMTVRRRHLAIPPCISGLHVSGEDRAVAVHGQAELSDLCELFEWSDPRRPEHRRALFNHFLSISGEAFREWVAPVTPWGAHHFRHDVHFQDGVAT
jgi:hypothetical protein